MPVTTFVSYDFDVFVSYRWVDPDQSWVRDRFVPSLKAAGLRVLIDVEDFIPGRDLIIEMNRAGSSSRHLICVISPDYFNGNRMVSFESLAARRSDPAGVDSRLIPLIFRETELPEWIRGLIAIDWTTESGRSREWKKLLQALQAPRLDVPFPGSIALFPEARDRPVTGFVPSSSWQAVNPAVIRRVLIQAIAVCLLAISARVAAGYPALLASIGLAMKNSEITDALNHSVWCGFGSLLASLLLWLQFMNTQFVLSLGRVLLFVSVLGLLCAAVSSIPGISPWTHGLIFTLFILAGSIYYFVFGIANYYWRIRSYGDVAAECLIFVLFLYIMRSPLMMLLGR
jgi:hypothetical protein